MRQTTAAAMPSVLLGVWAVFLVLLGTSPASPAVPGHPAAASLSALPGAPSPAATGPHSIAAAHATTGTPSPAATAAPRGAEQRTLVRAPSRSAADTAVQQTAAAEHTVRLPGAPPAVASGSGTDRPAHLRGTAACGPRQERAPPGDAYDPRHTRGPPATRHS
ncbi:hypothetical protein [Streptomyces genisteinicus]|uniref:Uncharacterized protein n=1 Tax=Streptomyces genisteinicus TaxID=2768068 RepID=A0A7H0I2F3_9ACTN|nr:hypothetical protein [Streptomyces genisteinicus]QNP66969.1 hypothetical protein IAG43_31360 [Streptomyces genisteinicus]